MALPPYSLGPPLGAAVSRNLRGSNAIGYRYQSPFLDVANTYVPPSVKEMFKLTRYYASSDQLVAPTVDFLANYPITGFEVDEERSDVRREGLKERWEQLISPNALAAEDVSSTISTHLIAFGNWFGSIQFPFDKYLVCRSCGNRVLAQRATYVFRDYKFDMTCARCGMTGYAAVEDVYKLSTSIRIVTWDPDLISIDWNPTINRAVYYLKIPDEIVVGIRMGRRTVLDYTPQVYLDAAKTNQQILLNPRSFFHVKRPGGVHWNSAWGWPEIVPAIKPSFYSQILRKGQEAIALGRMVPFTVLYPMSLDPNTSPAATIRLRDWETRVRSELQRHRLDSNYTAVMPLPIGSHNLWGDGRALMVTGEFQLNQQQCLMAVGVPPGLLTGDINWSSASVILRALEQKFLRRRRQILHFWNDGVVPMIAAHLHLPPVKFRMPLFKMADDMARKSLIQSLAQGPARKVSSTRLLKELDLDPEAEEAEILREDEREYHANVLRIRRSQALQALTQPAQPMGGQPPMQGGQPGAPPEAQAGPAGQAPGQEAAGPQAGQAPPPQGPGADETGFGEGAQGPQLEPSLQARLDQEAVSIVRQALTLPPDEARSTIAGLKTSNPSLYAAVLRVLKAVREASQRSKDRKATEKDLPQQAAPKRSPLHASI